MGNLGIVPVELKQHFPPERSAEAMSVLQTPYWHSPEFLVFARVASSMGRRTHLINEFM